MRKNKFLTALVAAATVFTSFTSAALAEGTLYNKTLKSGYTYDIKEIPLDVKNADEQVSASVNGQPAEIDLGKGIINASAAGKIGENHLTVKSGESTLFDGPVKLSEYNDRTLRSEHYVTGTGNNDDIIITPNTGNSAAPKQVEENIDSDGYVKAITATNIQPFYMEKLEKAENGIFDLYTDLMAVDNNTLRVDYQILYADENGKNQFLTPSLFFSSSSGFGGNPANGKAEQGIWYTAHLHIDTYNKIASVYKTDKAGNEVFLASAACDVPNITQIRIRIGVPAEKSNTIYVDNTKFYSKTINSEISLKYGDGNSAWYSQNFNDLGEGVISKRDFGKIGLNDNGHYKLERGQGKSGEEGDWCIQATNTATNNQNFIIYANGLAGSSAINFSEGRLVFEADVKSDNNNVQVTHPLLKNNGKDIFTAFTLVDQIWHNIKYVYDFDNNTAEMYLDGVLKHSADNISWTPGGIQILLRDQRNGSVNGLICRVDNINAYWEVTPEISSITYTDSTGNAVAADGVIPYGVTSLSAVIDAKIKDISKLSFLAGGTDTGAAIAKDEEYTGVGTKINITLPKPLNPGSTGALSMGEGTEFIATDWDFTKDVDDIIRLKNAIEVPICFGTADGVFVNAYRTIVNNKPYFNADVMNESGENKPLMLIAAGYTNDIMDSGIVIKNVTSEAGKTNKFSLEASSVTAAQTAKGFVWVSDINRPVTDPVNIGLQQ
ncbi:MAG: hypothetical protein J6N52_02705 [Clostridia bacterium]|nr:hypothetical protein [Clostridia bacterium]